MSRMRSLFLASVVAVAALGSITACDETADKPLERVTPTVSSSVKPTPVKPARVEPTPAPSLKLPSALPVFQDKAGVEQALRDTIMLAASHAVGVRSEDRNPDIVATSDFACGVKVAAIACAEENGTVRIYINVDSTWSDFVMRRFGHEPWQESALSSYATYLYWRQVQRDYPELVNVSSDDQAGMRTLAQVAQCHSGSVYAGVKAAMPAKMESNWRANLDGKFGKYFERGMKGQC